MFWKRKKKESLYQTKSSLFIRLIARINEILVRWAVYLQRETNKLSQKTLKGLLYLFCLFCLSASTYVIISSLREKGNPFRIEPIQAMPLAKRPIQRSTVSEGEALRIRQLRLSLDSLSKSPSGKVFYDSILKKHPNLLDTLRFLENIYYEQLKK